MRIHTMLCYFEHYFVFGSKRAGRSTSRCGSVELAARMLHCESRTNDRMNRCDFRGITAESDTSCGTVSGSRSSIRRSRFSKPRQKADFLGILRKHFASSGIGMPYRETRQQRKCPSWPGRRQRIHLELTSVRNDTSCKTAPSACRSDRRRLRPVLATSPICQPVLLPVSVGLFLLDSICHATRPLSTRVTRFRCESRTPPVCRWWWPGALREVAGSQRSISTREAA